jgi:hypothetical protein
VYVRTGKAVSTILGSIINEKVARVEMFVVGENEAFV